MNKPKSGTASILNRGVCCIAIPAMLAVGCAKKPENITGSYTSPMTYQAYECEQIQLEIGRVEARLAEVSKAQTKAFRRDATGVGLGLILFWPALFLLLGGDQEPEVARLKGERDALQAEAVKKGCIEQAPATEAETSEEPIPQAS